MIEYEWLDGKKYKSEVLDDSGSEMLLKTKGVRETVARHSMKKIVALRDNDDDDDDDDVTSKRERKRGQKSKSKKKDDENDDEEEEEEEEEEPHLPN